MPSTSQAIQRFSQPVVWHRGAHPGPVPLMPASDGLWVKFSDHQAALAEEREKREAAEVTLDMLQERREGEMEVVIETRERATRAEALLEQAAAEFYEIAARMEPSRSDTMAGWYRQGYKKACEDGASHLRSLQTDSGGEG